MVRAIKGKESFRINEQSERQPYWDNLKGILIILVVVVHFMQSGDISSTIDFDIVLFAMPLFIFVSGLFHKNQNIKERVLSLIIIGIVYNVVLIFIDNLYLGGPEEILLFRTSKIPWFVFTIAMSTIVTYIVRDCDQIMILIISVMLGCFACYDASLMEYMSIAKLVSWYPFYYLGYILSPRKIATYMDNKKLNMLGYCIIVVYILITILSRNGSISILRVSFLFSGNTVYPTESVIWIAVKLSYYIAVIFISVALMCIVPTKKIFVLSTIGERTMQIYFWHIIARSFIYATGIQRVICNGFIGHIVWGIISVAIAIVFSLKCFSFPTDWIIKAVKKREDGGD